MLLFYTESVSADVDFHLNQVFISLCCFLLFPSATLWAQGCFIMSLVFLPHFTSTQKFHTIKVQSSHWGASGSSVIENKQVFVIILLGINSQGNSLEIWVYYCRLLSLICLFNFWTNLRSLFFHLIFMLLKKIIKQQHI